MNNSIVTIDNKGNYVVNEGNTAVKDLYLTVFDDRFIGDNEYTETVLDVGTFLSMINKRQGVVDLAICNMAWGVYKIAEIDNQAMRSFFRSRCNDLERFSRHTFVRCYVEDFLAKINPPSTPIEKLYSMAESLQRDLERYNTESRQKQTQMFEGFNAGIVLLEKRVADMLEEAESKLKKAEQKLKEKDEELAAVKKELEQLRTEKDVLAEMQNTKTRKVTESVKLDDKLHAIRDAVIMVLEAKDEQGCYMFEKKSHWDGIYMILKEKGLYDGTQKGFGDYLGSLNIPNLRVGLPGKDLMRSPANGKVFATWKPISTPEKKLYRVAELFKEELEKLLPE